MWVCLKNMSNVANHTSTICCARKAVVPEKKSSKKPSLNLRNCFKQSYLVFVICFLSLIHQAGGRVWTDKEGRLLEAEFFGVKPGSVLLKLENGQILEFHLDQFCQQDQAYIANNLPKVILWGGIDGQWRGGKALTIGDSLYVERDNGLLVTQLTKESIGVVSLGPRRQVYSIPDQELYFLSFEECKVNLKIDFHEMKYMVVDTGKTHPNLRNKKAVALSPGVQDRVRTHDYTFGITPVFLKMQPQPLVSFALLGGTNHVFKMLEGINSFNFFDRNLDVVVIPHYANMENIDLPTIQIDKSVLQTNFNEFIDFVDRTFGDERKSINDANRYLERAKKGAESANEEGARMVKNAEHEVDSAEKNLSEQISSGKGKVGNRSQHRWVGGSRHGEMPNIEEYSNYRRNKRSGNVALERRLAVENAKETLRAARDKLRRIESRVTRNREVLAAHAAEANSAVERLNLLLPSVKKDVQTEYIRSRQQMFDYYCQVRKCIISGEKISERDLRDGYKDIANTVELRIEDLMKSLRELCDAATNRDIQWVDSN